MGTTYTIQTSKKISIDQKIVDDRLLQINQIFSTWDKNSELYLLNKKPVQQWIAVSDELFYVLKTAQQIYRQTDGYFDPGIGHLIDLWGFGIQSVAQIPANLEVQNAFNNSSIQYLQFKDSPIKAVKKIKDIYIDLSAIAKGYAVDEIAKLLNIENYLIEIGGEVRVRGRNNNQAWMLGVEHPDKDTPISIQLNNQAIATSGDYRNYVVWKGKRYMHIIDPNTGFPADSDLASVSVIHSQTMKADAYATAMMAMGKKKANILAKRLKLPTILILNQVNNYKIIKINY